MRGLAARAQSATTQARSRAHLAPSVRIGADPLALEWWVQSGENHARRTGPCRRTTSAGSTCQMLRS